MDLAFGGKTALVTGAGSQVGFGKEIALLLAAEGIDAVAVTDIDLEGAEETAAAVADLGCKSIALQADITDNGAVKAMVAKVVDEFGRIDILCNVAGAILHKDFVPIDQQDPAVWEKQFKLNLVGTMNVTQAVVPVMRVQKYGVIVNIGSGSTHQYGMGVGTYAMSKYAMDLFTKQLALRARARTASGSTAWPPVRRRRTSAPSCARASRNSRPKRPRPDGRRSWARSRWAGSARPGTSPTPPCSWPPT